MKRITLLIFGIAALFWGTAIAHESHHGNHGLHYHDASKSYEGYTLFTPLNDLNTYLIDMDGTVVHKWSLLGGGASNHTQLRDNGNLIYISNDGIFFEQDWDGNVVRQFSVVIPAGTTLSGTAVGDAVTEHEITQHHDYRLIYNKELGEYTIIFITYEYFSEQEVLDRGANTTDKDDPDSKRSPYDDASICGIAEVDLDGNLIWRWNFFDHTTYDSNRGDVAPSASYTATAFDGATENPSSKPGKIDINYAVPSPSGKYIQHVQSDWLHTNGLDYNEDLGYVVINSKAMSEFYVVDHQGTFEPNDPRQSYANAKGDAGDFVHRFGNPGVYHDGDNTELPGYMYTGHQQIWGAHDIHWVRSDLIEAVGASRSVTSIPAGIDTSVWDTDSWLIFDNGVWLPSATQSRIFEINPYISDAIGTISSSMVNPPDAGYDDDLRSNQIVWSYQSKDPTSFYSHYISGSQRLPNGNTLICSGARGHLFEVTAEGEVVWEFSPGFKKDMFEQTYSDFDDQTEAEKRGTITLTPHGSIFRAHRYSPDHPAFRGKTLAPLGTVFEEEAAPTGFGFGGDAGSGGGGTGGTGTMGGGAGY